MQEKENKGRDKAFKSALKVNEGIERPPVLNEDAIKALKKRTDVPAEAYFQGILSGDRTLLSKAITLVESSLPAHYEKAQQILEKCIPYSGRSFRIGITGVPGVGKSTFIEAFGMALIESGRKIAVLAVDPSSTISKGSILGDKTRMDTLSVNDHAYIRPSPSAGSLGGVARKTREIIILCEAAGFDRILVETVGVGQSETAVHSMVDFFLLLMLAGAGDELQGIKRGIMEMCDGMIINKADGDNIVRAQMARIQYQNALHLFPPPASGRTPRVEMCSSLYKTGINNVMEMISEYETTVKNSGYFARKRTEQQKHRMYETIQQHLNDSFFSHPKIKSLSEETIRQLESSRITSFQAAQKLLDAYFNEIKKQ
jgi:LAO/AO transport system kinase